MGKKIDIVVFGASGFTGRRIARELAAMLSEDSSSSPTASSTLAPTSTSTSRKLTFGLAGRNRQRLEKLAEEIEMPSLPIIIADAEDGQSMIEMAYACHLVISAAGPFRFVGEQVVAACVAAGTDYLDICGEPEFIERIELSYDELARRSGSFVASAVGFDSVPGDVGALFTAQRFSPPSRCSLVETFIALRAGKKGLGGHFATYQSAVEGFGSVAQLTAVRKAAKARTGEKFSLASIPGPVPPKRGRLPFFDSRMEAWTVPFVGADASVMRRTSLALHRMGKDPYRVVVYLLLPNFLDALQYVLFGSVFAFLAQWIWGRRLLLAFPGFFSGGIFSHQGPTEEQIAETSFEVTHLGRGLVKDGDTSEKVVKVKISGPEPGYVACSIFVVAAAIVLRTERDKLSVPPGVHTPAMMLQGTSYIERLRARGIMFKSLSD